MHLSIPSTPNIFNSQLSNCFVAMVPTSMELSNQVSKSSIVTLLPFASLTNYKGNSIHSERRIVNSIRITSINVQSIIREWGISIQIYNDKEVSDMKIEVKLRPRVKQIEIK